MAAPYRPAGRRGPSGAWSRLKAPQIDPLQVYGLPSKGETRLNDAKAQEGYYAKIVERYMKFCANSGGGDELERQLASLSLGNSGTVPSPALASTSTSTSTSTPTAPHGAKTPFKATSQPHGRSHDSSKAPKDPAVELPMILEAMRKLRESIVATHRHDVFAQRAYIFIIHAALLTRHMETYHPALLYLLGTIHKRTPLSTPELHEFVGYQILDLACRQSDLAAAYRIKAQYAYSDDRVETVLSALTHDNWFRFWQVRRAVNGYQKRLMEWAEESVRLQALKALGRSYLNVHRAYVEECAGASWPVLVEKGVGWELQDDGRVVIRKPKVR